MGPKRETKVAPRFVCAFRVNLCINWQPLFGRFFFRTQKVRCLSFLFLFLVLQFYAQMVLSFIFMLRVIFYESSEQFFFLFFYSKQNA